MAWWAILLIVLACVFVGLLMLLFTIYWFNLDMKLVYWLYNVLGKHYDNMDRDKKL
jgi:hypothetical protein